MGDLGNVIFFVASGFLISYFCSNIGIKKMIRYVVKIVVPSLLIILITAFIYYLLTFLGDNSFNIKNIQSDLVNVIFGGGSRYYGPQLWYIRVQVQGYIICSLIQYIVNNKNIHQKYSILVFCTIVTLLLWNYYIFNVFIGLLWGNIARDCNVTKKCRNILIIVILFITPFITIVHKNFSPHWDDSIFCWGYIVTSSYFGCIFLLGTVCCSFSKKYKIIEYLSKYTFSMYLVHVLVRDIYLKASHYLKIYLNWFISYMLIVIVCIICAILFEKVYSKVNAFILKILEV